MMEYVQTGALTIHIIAGYLALLSGLFIMVLKKGNRQHVVLGNWFYYGMLLVSLSALLLSYLKSNLFLFHIGIFVGYQNHAGRRSVKDKTLKSNLLDWLILVAAAINGVLMVISGSIVLTVFGGISVFLAFGDFRTQWLLARSQVLAKQAWLKRHIGMMMGAYIGAITAFLVVNIYLEQYGWIVWLAPTVLLVPLMRFWTYKYTQHKAQKMVI
jgi:hypothetical protein